MTAYWPNGSTSIPRVTSEFDAARKNPVTGIVQPHNGIDLIGFVDNCSPVDGTVIFAGYNGAAGNEVRIRADGPTAFHVGDCYRILHHASLYVSTGERVRARQPVGRMGTTGQSTGVHCHFETHEWRLWNYVNPRDYMARANGGSTAGGGSTPFEPPREWDEMATEAQVEAAAVRAVRKVLNEIRDGQQNQTSANVAFLADQAQGYVAQDRSPEGQLATAISRVTELLFALDGRADPRIIDPATGKPAVRAIAAFLQSRAEAPSSGVDVDEQAIVEGVLAGLAQNHDALIAAIRTLPTDTVAALKAAL